MGIAMAASLGRMGAFVALGRFASEATDARGDGRSQRPTRPDSDVIDVEARPVEPQTDRETPLRRSIDRHPKRTALPPRVQAYAPAKRAGEPARLIHTRPATGQLVDLVA